MRLLAGRSSREPDVIFIARERLGRLTPERLEGPADLVVEIIADDSVGRDRTDKFYEYEEAGVPEYWMVDPREGKRRFDLYRLTPGGTSLAVLPDGDGRYRSSALPGVRLDPRWLWQEPLPDPVALAAARIADAQDTASRS